MIYRILRVIILAVVISVPIVKPAEAMLVTAEGGSCVLRYMKTTGQIEINLGLFRKIVQAKAPWEIKQVSPTIYHLRFPGLNGRFLKIDTETKKIFEISNGTFGLPGGVEKLFPSRVLSNELPPQLRIPDSIMFSFPGAGLEYDTATGEAAFKAAGYRLFGREYLEAVSARKGIIHVRVHGQRYPTETDDRFVMIDINRRTAASVTGQFGMSEANEIEIDAKVFVEGTPAPTTSAAVHDDLGITGARKESRHASSWVTAESELFRKVIEKRHYDVLIVPFQVQDYAMDHISRMLMTRYLIRRIAATTDMGIPDPDLVDRALCAGSRTFTEQSVYGLANALGVKTLIRAYVGHSRDLKMRLTFVVQKRTSSRPFDAETKSSEIVFKDIAFSDEHLPSDAFSDLLPSVVYALGIKEPKKDIISSSEKLADIPIPPSPIDLIKSTNRSPLAQAAYTAVLGAISPNGTKVSEMFFQRSLMLLRGVNPQASDVVFLKAYVLDKLYRRPAALAVLSKPSTPEQKALLSYLNGDLDAMPNQLQQIKSPIPKFLMSINLGDLRWFYDPQTSRSEVQKIVLAFSPGWKLFLERRLTFFDSWNVPNSFEMKQMLDVTYPLKGYSMEDIARGIMVRGDSLSGDTIALNTSINEHRKRLLIERPDIAPADARGFINALDLLDLASAWAEQTIIKSVNLPVNVQALYEEGVRLAEQYERVWPGHPELTYLKARALEMLAITKKGDGAKNLRKQSEELDSDICTWLQGQTRSSNKACSSERYYENDFPRRAFWKTRPDGYQYAYQYGDRSEYQLQEIVETAPMIRDAKSAKAWNADLRDRELSLRYVNSDFSMLKQYYQLLPATEAESLLQKNSHRFHGSPDRVTFLAGLYEQRGDERNIENLYQDAIRITPGVWEPYYGLGLIHLKRGDVSQAVAAFRRYPLLLPTEKLNDSVDMVELSHNAYRAGNVLRWKGEIEEARPFFELSAGYQTGSGSSMKSKYLLALDDGDYLKAAQKALDLGRRYSNTAAYSNYLRLLTIMGHFSEAASLFVTLNLTEGSNVYWEAVLTGLRMAAKSDEDIRRWLEENYRGKLEQYMVEQYYLTAFLVDRKPDPSLVTLFGRIGKSAALSDRARAIAMETDRNVPRFPSYAETAANSRYLVMDKEYDRLFPILEQWINSHSGLDGQVFLPYFAWSGAKTGRAAVVNSVLQKRSKDFEYLLASAMLDASEGNHKNALRLLGLARFRITEDIATPGEMFSAWYQLVEACELLYKDSGRAEYRDRLLELSQIHQRLAPLDAWAYAVEAKYSQDDSSRMRALGIALYLDPRSYHLSQIPAAEKTRAKAWFKEHDPFQTVRQLQHTRT